MNTFRPAQRATLRLLGRVPIYLRDVRAEPRWAAMFTFGRVLAIRQLRHRVLARQPARMEVPGPMSAAVFADAPREAIVHGLRRDGIYTGFALTPEIVCAIRRFAETHVCYGSFDRNKPFLAARHAEAEATYGSRILVGHFLESIETCEAAKRVARDRLVMQIVAEYLRQPPKLIAHRLWWSFPTGAAKPEEISLASQAFHYDLDDWRQIKFFFYLCDVDLQNGAHSYVKCSHRRRPLRFQFSPFVGRRDTDILAAYGAAAVVTVTGRAGTGFAEDPFGYHAGLPVHAGTRLVMELSFGVSDLLKRRRYGAIAGH